MLTLSCTERSPGSTSTIKARIRNGVDIWYVMIWSHMYKVDFHIYNSSWNERVSPMLTFFPCHIRSIKERFQFSPTPDFSKRRLPIFPFIIIIIHHPPGPSLAFDLESIYPLTVSRVNSSNLDVTVDYISIGRACFYWSWNSRWCVTSTSWSTGWCFANRVSRIEPEHIGIVIIPKRQHENHTGFESSRHGSKTTMIGKWCWITKSGFLSIAERSGDGIAAYTRDGGVGVRNYFAVLDVETFDFIESTRCCTIGSEELIDMLV